MSVVIRELTLDDADAVASLWQDANVVRRRRSGVEAGPESDIALVRPGAFAVGAVDGDLLLSVAIALPALADDARSVHNVPGLAHISSVATLPDHWGRGLAARCVQAIVGQASRRGYARAQLWTDDGNTRARQLYERLGFQLSGRRTLDPRGVPIVHYHRDLPPLAWVSRAAARLVCLDPADRVLLMHWRDPLDGYQLWEPPGGGIEAGESAYDAVLREWREETGLPTPRVSEPPTMVGREVIFNGVRSVVGEDFFLGRLPAAGEPRPDEATEQEQDAYLGYAWVPWQQLAGLDDPVEPDLLPVLRRLSPDGPWA